MARFLFVVPPLVGHTRPTVAVATELTAQGHEVAWVGFERVLTPLVGPDARVFPCGQPQRDTLPQRAEKVRGLAAFKMLWEQFLIPLADFMAPGVRRAIAEFAPDAVLVDQQAIAGAMIADELGLPWATSATTSGELTNPLGGMPLVASWLDGQLADLRRRIASGSAGDPRFSPHLTLVFSTTALVGDVDDRDGTVKMIGPSLPAQATQEFPWEWLEQPRPTILVSVGTVSGEAGAKFLRAAADAVADRPHLRAVVVDRTGRDPQANVYPNVLVRERVPQVRLMPHLSAVVCHAGHNTVCESLLHGLPLVVAPIRDDQTTVAQQVLDAGAGIRLRFSRADAGQIGEAVDTVLADPGYAAAARRIGDSFRAAGGAQAAATHLLELCAAPALPN